MHQLKVLHITSWFPNPYEQSEALWIKRHIDALEAHCLQEVWHIRTYEGHGYSNHFRADNKSLRWLIRLNLRRWRFIEWLTFLQLLWLGIARRKSIQSSEVINVHIAYPLLRHWSKLKWLYSKPLVVTEHWSAYHYQFHIEKESTLRPLRKIFSHPDLLICVSEALHKDIRQFAADQPRRSAVVPNVVDTTVFDYGVRTRKPLHFFMVSQWKEPKDPFTVLRVFNNLIADYPDAHLSIGGYGPQIPAMQDLVENLGIGDSVTFTGRMSSKQIADEMNNASAFLHLSDYETFSVVCAEALCCGCPVVASGVGGIQNYLRDEIDGIMIHQRNAESLEIALRKLAAGELVFDRQEISAHAQKQFREASVGQHYADLLKALVNKTDEFS